MQTTVLIIAGSDPTGGAGLQADIKAMTSIGVYAGAVATCITVQNSFGVQRIEPLPPDLVSEQIKAVLEDHHVSHIKIGMVGTAEIAAAIYQALAEFTGEIILDPVLLSTTGQQLLPAADLDQVKSSLIPLATVITPNIPELTAITGIKATSPERILRAADSLLEENQNLRVVLVKGGHASLEGEVTDILLYKSGTTVKLLSSTRSIVETRNTHGTGCTLASAYAAFHNLSSDDEKAFYQAANFMQLALERSKDAVIVKNPDGRGGLLFNSPDQDNLS